MNLSKKVLLIVFFSFSLIMLAVYLNAQQTVHKSFLSLEQEQAVDNVERVNEAIEMLSQSTDMMLMDWSVWDDPYQFVVDKNKDFVDSNFNIFSAGSANIDMFLFFNMKSELVASYMLNVERIAAIPVPNEILEVFYPGGQLAKIIANPGPKSHISGLMMASPEPLFSTGIFFISANNIVKTNGEGPPRGMLVMGTRLTDQVLEKIKTTTGLNVAIYRIDSIENNANLKDIYAQLSEGKKIVTNTENKTLYAYSLIHNINQKPIAILQVMLPRTIYNTGIQTIRYLGAAFLVSGILFSLLLFYLLRISVVNRLEDIEKNVRRVGESGDFNLKLVEKGNDEISTLQREINKLLNLIIEYNAQKKKLLDQVEQEIKHVNIYTKQLKNSEDLLNEVINSMPSSIAITDKENNIVNLNSFSEKEIGMKTIEAKGKKIFTLFPFLREHQHEFDAAKYDVTQVVIQNDSRSFHVIVYPFTNNEDQYYVIRIDDITEQLRFRQRLVQNDRLASIGVLTAGVAHEINNPVNFLSASTTPLKNNINDMINILNRYNEIGPQDDISQRLTEINQLKEEINLNYVIDETNQLINGIMDGAARTAETVKNLKVFTRLGEDTVKKSNIHEGIDSTLNLLKHNYKNRIVIIKEYGDIPQINYHPGKMNQVFMNIISNAVDSIPDKGELVIKTEFKEDHVIISFKDTGVGIKEDILQRIFEPFFTTKDEKGTGLGLSISYSIIQEHKGTIQVKSKEGKGTEFIVTLPAEQK